MQIIITFSYSFSVFNIWGNNRLYYGDDMRINDLYYNKQNNNATINAGKMGTYSDSVTQNTTTTLILVSIRIII